MHGTFVQHKLEYRYTGWMSYQVALSFVFRVKYFWLCLRSGPSIHDAYRQSKLNDIRGYLPHAQMTITIHGFIPICNTVTACIYDLSTKNRNRV